MYIAICDDDPAIRNHVERLFQRDALLRQKNNIVIYLDSFGLSLENMTTLMKYDLFFINSMHDNSLITPAIEYIRSHDVKSPIYFYNVSNEFREELPISQNVDYIDGYLDKFLIDKIVGKTIDTLKEKPQYIELRNERITRYTLPDDILFIRKKDAHICVRLVNDEEIIIPSSLNYYINLLSEYPQFILTKMQYIVNTNYVTSINLKKMILHNNYAIPLFLLESMYLTQYINSLKQ